MTRPSQTAVPLQSLSRMLRSARYLFGCLLLLTVGLIAWHTYGMEKVVDMMDDRYPVNVEDDRLTGGHSVGSIARHGRDVVMDCKVVNGYQYPYCKLTIQFQSIRNGLDLSDFDHFTIDATYTGTGAGKLNFMVVNAEEGLTRLDKWETFKINQVDYLVVPPNGHIVAPVKWFAVAPWWKDLAKPSLEHSFVRMDNVSRVEVMNSVGTPEGDYTMTIHGIKAHGKIISMSHLLLVLVGLWIVSAVSFPTVTALLLRRQLKESDMALALLTQVNSALELEARELAGQAHIDPLTGVLNRQGLRAALMSTSSLLAAPMSVIFIDIDHFKRINDTHGHDVGDEVLRKFAHVIGSGIRSSDRLVRWGGEEFLIICPVTDVYQASLVAEGLRVSLHRQHWPASLSVTASFGVAQHGDDEDIGVVIKRADTELYGAKANGRDRVHAYGMDKPPSGTEKTLQLAAVA
jgi:diguanylate cyclase (GGDEF)-like protein